MCCRFLLTRGAPRVIVVGQSVCVCVCVYFYSFYGMGTLTVPASYGCGDYASIILRIIGSFQHQKVSVVGKKATMSCVCGKHCGLPGLPGIDLTKEELGFSHMWD